MPVFDKDIHKASKNGSLSPEDMAKFREFISCNEIFNLDYTWGYLSALIDVQRWFSGDTFNRLCKALKVPRTSKTMCMLFSFFLKHHNTLRMGKMDKIRIGYNQKEKRFYCA